MLLGGLEKKGIKQGREEHAGAKCTTAGRGGPMGGVRCTVGLRNCPRAQALLVRSLESQTAYNAVSITSSGLN